LRVADSSATRKEFGPAVAGSRGPSAYRLVRIVTLIAARSHLIATAAFGSYGKSEYAYAQWHWCALASPGSIPAKLRRMRENILEFTLPPRRTKRRYPRAVKLKMSSYAKKRPAAKRKTRA